jgi:hypothetical protein
MDAWQVWYPEIEHSGTNTIFASFYVPKVSEMLWNITKHDLGYDGVEWIFRKFGTPK